LSRRRSACRFWLRPSRPWSPKAPTGLPSPGWRMSRTRGQRPTCPRSRRSRLGSASRSMR